MRRMLTVAAVTAGLALLVAVVVFGRSHAGAIKPPALVLPAAGSRSPAATFAATTLSGSKVSLGKFRGKPLVINFFAAWCDPCKREAPQFVRLDQRYGARIGLLSVAINTTRRSSLDGFIHDHSMTWPVVWDRSGGMIDSYHVPGQPITYIIDANGRVVFRIIGQTTERRIGGVLDKLLA
jgi:cytochrome c biogenesis protein CcmG/thiol:disulfide interchange protein DsbE